MVEEDENYQPIKTVEEINTLPTFQGQAPVTWIALGKQRCVSMNIQLPQIGMDIKLLSALCAELEFKLP